MENWSEPKIRFIANLWTIREYPTPEKEWSLEKKMKAIKDAGFDGITAQLTMEHRKWAEKFGLKLVGYFSSGRASEFRRLLQDQRDAGAHHINVQLADEDTLTPEATGLAIRLIEEGRKLGVEPAVEVHRDTCTETPEKTYALADAYKKVTGELLPMTWDYSHIAVVKHINPPYADRLLLTPDLIQRSQQIHLRPFNGHHCQIPVTNGKGKLTPEIETWFPFAERLFEVWLKGNQSGRELFVCPEMGPKAKTGAGYNLSILPSSWEDAVILRGHLEKIWKKVLKSAPRPLQQEKRSLARV
jgi:hypothetical protein